MDTVILTATQVEELTVKRHNLECDIEEIQNSMRNGDDRPNRADRDNYSDSNIVYKNHLVDLVREKADYEELLECYVLAEPTGKSIDIGSLVTYVILDTDNPKLVGQNKTIMIVQKNYSNARPKDYRYVSLDTAAGRNFYGTKVGDIITYTAENGNEFEALVTEVDNNFCKQQQNGKTFIR